MGTTMAWRAALAQAARLPQIRDVDGETFLKQRRLAATQAAEQAMPAARRPLRCAREQRLVTAESNRGHRACLLCCRKNIIDGWLSATGFAGHLRQVFRAVRSFAAC
jgi:hypothetical protein